MCYFVHTCHICPYRYTQLYLTKRRIEYNWREGKLKPIKELRGHDEHVVSYVLFICTYTYLRYVYMYIHTYIRMYAHIYVCTYCIRICTYVHVYVPYVCTYVYSYVHLHVRVYVRILVCTFACTCVHTYTRMYICMYVCMYVYLYVHLHVRVYSMFVCHVLYIMQMCVRVGFHCKPLSENTFKSLTHSIQMLQNTCKKCKCLFGVEFWVNLFTKPPLYITYSS